MASSEQWLRSTGGHSQWDRRMQAAGKPVSLRERRWPRAAQKGPSGVCWDVPAFFWNWSISDDFISEVTNWNNSSLRARTPQFPNEAVLDLCVSWKQKTSVSSQELLPWNIYFGGKWHVFNCIQFLKLASFFHFSFPCRCPSLLLFLPLLHSFCSRPPSSFTLLILITWKIVISGFKGKAFHMTRVEIWSYLLLCIWD